MVNDVQVSGVEGPVITPDTMDGPVAVAPMITQADEDGHAIWLIEVRATGSVSAAKVTLVLGVVAP
jgi:hypothetical protein